MKPWLILIVLVSASAHALDINEVGNPAEMTAKLKAEGQRSIGHADLQTDDKHLLGMIFTMNLDRSVGYILQSDKPYGDDTASKFKVYQRLADIRLFDARPRGVPLKALLRANNETALKKCAELIQAKKLGEGSCGAFNKIINEGNARGERVMLQGFNTIKLSDGSYAHDTTLTTVTANVPDADKDVPIRPGDGIVSAVYYTTLPEGATIINGTLFKADYTQFGISSLKENKN